MNYFKVAGLCLTLLLIFSACEQKSGEVLVTIGSETITEPDLALLARVNPRLQRRLATPEGRQQVLQNYVEQELLSQEAKKRGLNRDDMVQAKIALYEKVILAQSLLEAVINEKADEYFKSNPEEFEKVNITHIYIPFKTEANNPALEKGAKVTRSEEQAKQEAVKAKAALAKSEFAAVVAKFSEDANSKEDGGALGWVGRDDARLSRWGWTPIVTEAFSLQGGQVSEPIKSDNGYHLVMVVEPAKADDFEQVKPRIRFKIQAQIKDNLVSELKDKYPVEFAGAPAAAPQAETADGDAAADEKPAN